MNREDIESAYDALAQQIDRVGAAKTELYLAKLALLMAQEIGDVEKALACIEEAARSLDA